MSVQCRILKLNSGSVIFIYFLLMMKSPALVGPQIFCRLWSFFLFFFFSSGRHDASSDQTQEDRLLVQRLLALWHFHAFLQPPQAGLFRPVGSFSHTGLHIHCISFLYWFPAFSFLIISDLCYFIFVLYLILYQFLNLSTLTLDLFFFFACPC